MIKIEREHTTPARAPFSLQNSERRERIGVDGRVDDVVVDVEVDVDAVVDVC